MKQIEAIAVLSVDSDQVRFTVLSNRDGSEVASSVETFPLMTAARNATTSVAAVEPDDRTECSAVAAAAEDEWPTVRGFVEQDPDRIWEAVLRVMTDAVDKMCRDGTPVTYVKSVAIVNEMGTLVAWNAVTGKPVHNAIHWSDVRMTAGGGGTGAAVQWLLQRSAAVRCSADSCRFGTLDAWLTWKLTAGATYQTDATNASHTGLLDLSTLCWDRDAVRSCGLAGNAWPTVRRPHKRSTAVIVVGRLYGLSVHVTMARPGAVLYAQACYRRGQTAVTLTDLAAMAVCAHDRGPPRPQPSRVGPRRVVGYCEPNAADRKNPKIVYGLLAVSGATSVAGWLRNMGVAKSWDECAHAYEAAAPALVGLHKSYMVPAFGGLPSAPYGRPDARPVVCGIGGHTGPAHLIAAAVDSMCHGVDDVVGCAAAGSASKLAEPLYVDGPCSALDGLMRRLADVTGHRLAVNRPDMAVTGAARMAAAAMNVEYGDRHATVHYEPASAAEQRSAWRGQWAKAVRRSYGWAAVDGLGLDDRYAAQDSADRRRTGFSALADALRRFGLWYGDRVNEMLYAVRSYFAPDVRPRRSVYVIDGSAATDGAACER
ncbi:Uncharacterized protein FWK35_00013333 [Aphis craccivora]|uniref:Glycerol kinase n=1 Tax=Aphis craccivora TaxID=307492 RepID=A0A6G0YMX4_APHCR|nr:Uncharacterized protein FWK35_00013333 [Aphis craccivora]